MRHHGARDVALFKNPSPQKSILIHLHRLRIKGVRKIGGAAIEGVTNLTKDRAQRNFQHIAVKAAFRRKIRNGKSDSLKRLTGAIGTPRSC